MYTVTLTRTRFTRIYNWVHGKDPKLQVIGQFLYKLIINKGGCHFKVDATSPSTDWIFISAEHVGQHPVYLHGAGRMIHFPKVMLTWNDFLDLPNRIIDDLLKTSDALVFTEVSQDEFHGSFENMAKKVVNHATYNFIDIDSAKKSFGVEVKDTFPVMAIYRN